MPIKALPRQGFFVSNYKDNLFAMINADQNELDKFSQLAHRWWDPKSEFKPLHDINPLRLEWIDGHAGISGKRILDVGCGGGILSESMAERGAARPS